MIEMRQIARNLVEGTAFGAELCEQRVGLGDQRHHLVAAFGQHLGGLVGVGQ